MTSHTVSLYHLVMLDNDALMWMFTPCKSYSLLKVAFIVIHIILSFILYCLGQQH